MEYEEIGSPLLFTQKEKEEEKEEQKKVPMEINQPFKPLNIMDIGISDDEDDSNQDPVIISEYPKRRCERGERNTNRTDSTFHTNKHWDVFFFFRGKW